MHIAQAEVGPQHGPARRAPRTQQRRERERPPCAAPTHAAVCSHSSANNANSWRRHTAPAASNSSTSPQSAPHATTAVLPLARRATGGVRALASTRSERGRPRSQHTAAPGASTRETPGRARGRNASANATHHHERSSDATHCTCKGAARSLAFFVRPGAVRRGAWSVRHAWRLRVCVCVVAAGTCRSCTAGVAPTSGAHAASPT
jgi:hypothetical protein